MLVFKPWGSTAPCSVAEELVTFVAGLLITTGAPVAVRVVRVLSLPVLVPSALLAMIRKW
jgi:hypothetical protein